MLPEIELFVSWLRRKAPHASTAVHYGSDLRLFFTWLNKPCEEVKVQDIDTFIEYSQKKGHAIGTINRRLCALRSFYQFLIVQDESAPANPVIPKRHFIRPGERLPRDVEDKILEALFAVIHDVRDRAMFLLMLRCGLRVGEVRNLSLNDLYLEPTAGSLPRVWLHGKGSYERVAYLSSQAEAALQTWLESRPRVKSDAVFINRFGERLSVTGIQGRLARYCRKAGIWVTCHQFRHTFGRHLTEAHVPVTSMQRLFGHARLKSTEVYLHISDAQAQEDYQAAMEEIMRELPLEVER
ncbi:tyrosine-type recombinase/integrase [Thauera sp.]|uniref:tyrosine-type recombinase/integrase n=1 Tax=Thauera sp. TaxID=1905334 RepID=UPI002632DC8B|nr:tyrosine-type recombinase/integrase [Thauera sp.]